MGKGLAAPRSTEQSEREEEAADHVMDVKGGAEANALEECPDKSISPETWRQGLARLKAELPHHDAFTWQRFLLANDGDGAKAAGQLKEMDDWRRNNDIEHILDNFRNGDAGSERWLADYKAVHPHCFHGRDRMGRAIYVDRVGRINSKALKSRYTEAQVLHYHAYHQEYLWTHVVPQTSPTQTITTIVDLQGLSLLGAPWGLVRKLLHIDTTYYPERLAKLFVINAPRMFSVIWSFLQPILDDRTKSKVKVLSKNYKDALEKVVDPAMLPPEYGGHGPTLGQSDAETAFSTFTGTTPSSPIMATSADLVDCASAVIVPVPAPAAAAAELDDGVPRVATAAATATPDMPISPTPSTATTIGESEATPPRAAGHAAAAPDPATPTFASTPKPTAVAALAVAAKPAPIIRIVSKTAPQTDRQHVRQPTKKASRYFGRRSRRPMPNWSETDRGTVL